ncbi:MAG: DUF1284 domain-containing protein [Oscillospiraceae bacterium]|nr:DUF1284 domain-containing protein [Oscillospiraceae bacterium]
MNLRPHHLLCIQKFTGHGYDEAFTEHMTDIVSKLKDEPITKITVTKGCDELCKVCPNNINNSCTSLQKVDFMDSSVLGICEIAYGENVSWEYLANKARKRIFETDEFNNICSSCEWFELCKNTK